MSNVFARTGERVKQALLHFTLCGLDDVYLANGYEITDYDGDKGVAIKELDQLHNAIGYSLVKEKKALNGRELRFLRKEMNMRQADLARLLGLSSQQVARWEKGTSEISGPADLLVRAAYLEHLGNDVNLLKLRSNIDDMDSPASGKNIFEETPQGWKHRHAA